MENRKNYESIASVITVVENSLKMEQAELSSWFVRLSHDGFRSAGFWSGEVLPPGHQQHDDWTMILRFQSMDQAMLWHASPARQEIIGQFAGIGGAEKAHLSDTVSNEAKLGSAFTAIVTNLKPGAEDPYWDWEYKIQAAQATMPGFGGVYVQPPPPGKDGQWTTMLRFDSAAALENWFEAPVRKELLQQTGPFVSEMQVHKLESSFPGFFPDEEDGKPTPRWKGASMVLIGLFPALVVIKLYVTPHLVQMFVPIVALCLSTILSVSVVSFVAMPILVKQFGWWLSPPAGKASTKTELLGLAVAAAIFLTEIAAGKLLPLP